MKKQLCFFLVCICFFCGCKINKNDDPASKELKKEQAQKDIAVFSDILKTAHPSLNLYISKQRLNTLLDSVKNSITDATTIVELYNKFAVIINEIGCSHTDIDLPAPVYDTLKNRKFFFPYPLCWIDNKLIVNVTGNQLTEGTEIRSINGQPARDIVQSLMVYNPVEGRHRNTQQNLAVERFGVEYFFKYGKQQEFVVDVIDTAGEKEKITIESVTLKELRKRQSDVYYYDNTDVDYDFYFISVLDRNHIWRKQGH